LTEPGKNSPYRDRSVEENLDLFQRMKAGEFPDGTRTLRAKVDMASPNLMLSCAAGKRHPEAKLTVRRPDPPASEEFILISMKDVLVTSVQCTGTRGPEGLVEQVTLNIAKVDFEYRPQRADGTPEPGVHFSWDLKKNTKI